MLFGTAEFAGCGYICTLQVMAPINAPFGNVA